MADGTVHTKSVAKYEPGFKCDRQWRLLCCEVSESFVVINAQVEALRPALERILGEWGQLENDLSDVSLHTSRLCALQQLLLHTPAFSPKQVRQKLEELQVNQIYRVPVWACSSACIRSLRSSQLSNHSHCTFSPCLNLQKSNGSPSPPTAPAGGCWERGESVCRSGPIIPGSGRESQ